MKGLHLKCRNGWWYYQRRRPQVYADVEPRLIIHFSLKTQELGQARLKAAQISLQLDEQWREAKARGVSLKSSNAAERFKAATTVQQECGFEPKSAETFTDQDLIDRLRQLLKEPQQEETQKAVLGMVEQPKLSFDQALDLFWAHIEDEWIGLSHDQQRSKKNIYLRSIGNFELAVGKIDLHALERKHAHSFRSWWLKRLTEKGLKPHTGNKEITSLRRLVSVIFDIQGIDRDNPFARVRLKEDVEVSRIPVTVEQIHVMIQPESMPALHVDFHRLLRLLINTGMRPVEAIGLELEDIRLDHEVPHVYVRKNRTRGLKNPHSERLLPLLGVSFQAAQELVEARGWGKRLGKNMYATSIINRNLKSSGIVSDKRQSLYSLRHWFQDQLTKLDVVDRAQAQLMGHKFHRPRYGYGKDLAELKAIIEKFAIP